MPLLLGLVAVLAGGLASPFNACAQDMISLGQRSEAVKLFRFGSRSLTPDLTAKSKLTSSVSGRVTARKTVDPTAEPQAYVFVRLSEVASRQRRAEFKERGVHLVERLGAKTWVAGVTEGGARHLADDDGTLWASPIEPEAKVPPGLETVTIPYWRQRPGGSVVFSVVFHRGVAASEVVALASALGAELENFKPDHFTTLRAATFVMDPARLGELAEAEGVARIGPSAPPPTPDNELNVQPLSQVDVVQGAPYNLSGVGVSVGMWEANDGTNAAPEHAVRDTHNNFEYTAGTAIESRVVLEADHAGPPASGFSNHATGVAGTLGAADRDLGSPLGSLENSRAEDAEGMAPEVTIASWTSPDDLNEMISAVTSAGGATDPTPIVISNHSYSVSGGWIFRRGNPGAMPPVPDQNLYRNNAYFGRYTFRSAEFDQIVADHGLMVFKSAGNDRNDDRDPTAVNATVATHPAELVPPATTPAEDCNTGGLTTPGGIDIDADCLGPIATAKNVFTIGSANGGAALADFSGFGPTDDGRIKPDLVTQGAGITTLGAASDTADRANRQGTSLSSPAAAGVAALMLQQADSLGLTISAAGMKALLAQTADDFTADPYPRAGLPETMTGPDYATGWGIVNAETAADLLRLPGGAGLVEETLTDEGSENSLLYPVYIADDEPELKVTLAWADPAGTGLAEPIGAQDAPGSTAAEGPGTAAGVVDPVLVNDLDLRLLSPTRVAHLPWGLNPDHPERPARRNAGHDDRNNVEQVSVLAPESGLWWAEVSAGVGALSTDTQAFALAGPLSGLKIVEPTRDNPALAGSPTDGSRVLVRLRASEGLDLSQSNLTVAVDGDALAAAQIALHSQPGLETWLVIAPGARAVGCYDLEVRLVNIPEVADRAQRSLCYEDTATAMVDRVVAVDRTNSMRYNSITRERNDEKLISARDAASAFVALSNDQDAISLVQFQLVDGNDDRAVDQAELAQVVQPLIPAQVGDTDNRLDVRDLAEGITPAQSDWHFPGETSIGAAIAESRTELDENGRPDAHLVIALVTDGRENYPPYWSREGSGDPIKPEIVASNLIIHTVGIGQDAEHEVLRDIAESTGGNHYPPDEGEASYSLLSRLTSIFKAIDEDVRGEQRFFYQEGVPESLAPGKEFEREGTFTVEPHLDWITVSFHWAPEPSVSGVVLIPPDPDPSDGVEPLPVEPLTVSDDKHTTYRVLRPTPGEWRYQVPSSIRSDGEFTAIASGPTLLRAGLKVGETAESGEDRWSTPLRVWVAEEVAVTGATVAGTLIRPDRSKRPITLRDDGGSADGVAGDGVYGLVAEESIPGAYTVEIVATGEYGDTQPFERYLTGSFVIPGRPVPPPQIGEGRPGGGFCGGATWCCWLWAAFIIAYMVTLWALLKLICTYRRRRYAATTTSN